MNPVLLKDSILKSFLRLPPQLSWLEKGSDWNAEETAPAKQKNKGVPREPGRQTSQKELHRDFLSLHNLKGENPEKYASRPW